MTIADIIQNMFRKLFCKHDYETIAFGKSDCRIIHIRRCKKCGKRIKVVM